MRTDLLGGYFIEQKKADSFVLKEEYSGKRNGKEVMCDRVRGYHPTFEDAAKRFLELYAGDKTDKAYTSLLEYINDLKKVNSEAVNAVQESMMQRFVMYVPTGDGPKDEHSIIDLIPVGRDNAISRKLLVQLCVNNGLIDGNRSPASQDRQMRKLIEKARLDYVILNLSDGNGYYRVSREDLQDLQRYIRQGENRAKSTFRSLTMAKKMYEDLKAGRL